MKLFAISDLHLSLGKPKPMDVFGPAWENHAEKIRAAWQSLVSDSDMVLIAGDISWAMTFEGALPDLTFVGDLPGRKVIIKGNHDYWWPGITRLRKQGPPSIRFIQNDVLEADEVIISGTRLWSYPYIQWDACTEARPDSLPARSAVPEADDEKVGRRELERLRLCLRQMSKEDGRLKVFLTHFPPVAGDFRPNPITHIMSEAGIQVCVFGHLHNVPARRTADRIAEEVRYVLTSCDYLGFIPKLVGEVG